MTYTGTETLDSAIGLAKTIGTQFFNPENENTQRLGRGLKATGQVLGESWQDTREFKEWYNLPHNIGAVGARGIEATGAVISNVVGKPVAGFARDQLNLDPRIAGAVALASEIALTAGTAKVGQVAKARVGDTIEGLAYGLGGTGGAGATRGAGKVVSKTDDLIALEKLNAARAKKLAKGDIKRSAEVTVGLDPNEVKVYGANRAIKEAHVPRELGGATGPTRIAGIPHKNIHHELMKDYYAEYVVNARKLVEQGLATEQDVINLARIAKKHGFGMGDYKSASAFVDKIPHDYGHEIMKRKGVQPTPSTKLESPYSGPDLITEKSRISKISNIKDLTDDFEQAIKDIGIPMRDEINSLQDAWDRVLPNDRMKLFELRWARDAIKKKLTEEYPTAIKVKTDKRFIKAQKQYKDFKDKLEKEMLELRENTREVARQKKELAIENLNPDQ